MGTDKKMKKDGLERVIGALELLARMMVGWLVATGVLALAGFVAGWAWEVLSWGFKKAQWLFS